MHPYIKPIAKLFKQHAHAENAAGAKAYMRNQFEYFGLKAAVRQSISKNYMKENLPPYSELETIVKELRAFPEREFQYFAIDLIAAMKKYWNIKIISLMDFVLTNKSWCELNFAKV